MPIMYASARATAHPQSGLFSKGTSESKGLIGFVLGLGVLVKLIIPRDI